MNLRFSALLLAALPLCTPPPAFAFSEEEHCQVSNQGLRMAIAFYRDCQRDQPSTPLCKTIQINDLRTIERFADAGVSEIALPCRKWTGDEGDKRVPTFGYLVSLVDYMHDPNDILSLPDGTHDGSTQWSFLALERLPKMTFYQEIKFAHHDVNHFQEHALLSFQLWHNYALAVANQYHQAPDGNFARLLYALTLNAVAIHFLEDFLAAGHFATPRFGLHDAAAKAYHDTYNGRGHDFSGRQSDWPTADENGAATKWRLDAINWLKLNRVNIEHVRDAVFPVKAFWTTFSSQPLHFTGDGTLVYAKPGGRVKVLPRPDCSCSPEVDSHSRCSLTGLPEHAMSCLDPEGYQYDLVATIVAAAVLDVLCVWPTEVAGQVAPRSSFFPTWEPYGLEKGVLLSPRGCLLPFGCYPRERDGTILDTTPRHGLILDATGGFQAILGGNQSAAGEFSAGIIPFWQPHSEWRPGSKSIQWGFGLDYSYIQANQYKAYGPNISFFFPITSIDFQVHLIGGYHRYSTPVGSLDRGHVDLRAEFGYGVMFIGIGPGLEQHYVQGQGLRPALGLGATISMLFPLSSQGEAAAQSNFAAAMSNQSP